jgi:energy-coupling factor transporter ATP-binding protein EcfA2
MERAHEAFFWVGLGEARYRNVGTYSTGMKQMTKLAQAIAHGPKLLFLDEPTNGLDPPARQRMIQLIQEIRDRGDLHLILSSHLLRDVEECCDEVLILKNGRMAAVCNLEEERRANRKFLELETRAAESKGGYAAAMGEDFYRRQREMMTEVLRQNDVVITTAAVPGKKAPVLITADMVRGMPTGSVIVDLAAERGGNCELTRPGETVVESGVTILGPLNLPSTIPYHASQMYARNIATFLKHLVRDGALAIDPADEITRETLVTHHGEVVHPLVRQALGAEPVLSHRG